ncbi:MAG: hypothetical protein N0C84_20355 [Candidatus Thiodiazotropha taylori]|uniref:Uncharacterized protein n=1 Tax=Candidatus Thiodiazotropha taylori TaxID=2792791 RepID=A0A9E4N734_9GAMM|nr:hypothetical protein [Candidatus Thiodiazotropha taylori]MCW4258821.1 hypothetical protein [Candidatus Thiodiazotropha taylori]
MRMLFVMMVLFSSNVYSESNRGSWQYTLKLGSASIARAGGELIESTGLSWPDGRQIIVTYWKLNSGEMVRCFDNFQADMQSTGSSCQKPSARDNKDK